MFAHKISYSAQPIIDHSLFMYGGRGTYNQCNYIWCLNFKCYNSQYTLGCVKTCNPLSVLHNTTQLVLIFTTVQLATRPHSYTLSLPDNSRVVEMWV